MDLCPQAPLPHELAQRLAPFRPAPEPPCTAAVLLPLMPGPQGLEVLFEVRALTVPQPGEICFPGGRAEPGETPLRTALRETWEELAIPPELVEPLGFLPLEARLPHRRIQPVVGLLAPQARQALRPAPAEVGDAFAVPLAWLLAHPPARYAHPDGPQPLPPILQSYLTRYHRPIQTLYWEYGGHGIWGMTARILQSFLELLG